MAIRITGMNSGLDTEALVEALVSAYSVKKDKYTKAQTKLSWEQEAWKSLNTKIYSLYNSVGNLRYTSAYKTKSVKMSDESKAKIEASTSAMNGTQTLEISKVAKSGYLTGAQLKSGTTAGSTMASLGFTGEGIITVKSGNKTTDIKVNSSTKISEFVEKLNGAGVSASFDAKNGRMFIAASGTGVKNDFSLTAGNADGVDALSALGLNAKASEADMKAYKAFANYAKGIDADGNVVDLFDVDNKGNYTQKAGVTYDEAATQAYIESVRNNVTTKSDENEELKGALSYASAYKNIEDVKAAMKEHADYEEGDWEELEKLIQLKDASKVYVDAAGNTYDASKVKTNEDGSYTYTDEDGKETNFAKEDLKHGAVRLVELEEKAGLATKTVSDSGKVNYAVNATKVNRLKSSLSTVDEYEADTSHAARVSEIQTAYADDTLEELQNGWNEKIAENQAYLDEHAVVSNLTESAEYLTEKVSAAQNALINPTFSEGANKVNGQDAVIILNGAEFKSSTNQIEVNGLTITALGETDGEMTVTVDNDVDGLYDKIKGFIKEYNTLINEMQKLYNADSAKGYEPLTDDEKEAMTDKEIEKWEEKIKNSLFRRDDTLDGVIRAMTSAMSKSYSVDGKTYSLGSFGISTLGLQSATNEQYSYHIYGDSEDAATSGRTDKLKSALREDPDSVIEFMKQLTTGLYDAIDKKMKSSSLSSAYTVYNDKEMASEYSDYTDTIKKWEEKLTDMEDSYYKKFTAMEKALAKLQSQQSSMGNLFG